MLTKDLLFILHKTKILNANKSLHYQAKGKKVKTLREIGRINGVEMLEKDGKFEFDKFKIVVTVFPPTRRRIDPPNLYPTVKAIVDGLTDAGFWPDDSFSNLLELSFKYGGLSGESDIFHMKFEISEIPSSELNKYVIEAILNDKESLDEVI